MNEKKEKVIAVTVQTQDSIAEEHRTAELSELVRTAGGEVVFHVVQNMREISPATYIGKGKAEEVRDLAELYEVDSIVFNNELSGSQTRNLEEVIGKKIVDRTNLILDIFATRAQTMEAKLQVKLAQLEYRLPRLVGGSDYLSREGGGIGTRGPGEQKLETDRRAIRREINRAKRELERVIHVRATKRKNRRKSAVKIVSLVGYTNAGKSTILNRVVERCGSVDKSVYADDKLFATLDTSLRSCRLEGGGEFLLVDTVGFVTDIPTNLIESFRSTLEEIRYSDLIVQVVDATDENRISHMETTTTTLAQMKMGDIPVLTVFNKMDAVKGDFHDIASNSIYISALEEEGITKLLDKIRDMLEEDYIESRFRIPFEDYRFVDDFHCKYELRDVKNTDEGIFFSAKVSPADLQRYERYRWEL